jgi:hypothetical protein
MSVLNWLMAHAEEIVTAVGAVVTSATVVVTLTPSKKDDAVVGKIAGAFRWVVEKLQAFSVVKKH